MHSVRKLTTLFTPNHYKLDLDISHRTARTFHGTVSISGQLAHAVDNICLHAKDLAVTEAHINNMLAVATYGDDDEVCLTIPTMLAPGEHTVHVAFTGTITDAMHGLYPGYYKEDGQDKELLVTQLESHSAREVFPCIDEPAAKAAFDITLHTEAGLAVLGNMPIAAQHTHHMVCTTRFEPTPRMSPYLVAFAAGELEYIETTSAGGVIVRAYAPPSKVAHAQYALDLAAKSLDYLDDFFHEPFPLPKCDLLCVPDFSALAMENWGLIVGRDLAFLYDPATSAPAAKEMVATVVTHELAHQWFGNLVTMQWWDDLWLNESFAKWMEYEAANHFHPEWRLWEQFASTEQNIAFMRDSLADVQAVRQSVNHPDELHALFDPAIVYAKGSCLIRMLQAFVGKEAFRDGLRAYIKAHKYGNASANDLWEALETASGKNVRAFMTPWLTQPGHPVVEVTQKGTLASLAQRRFYTNKAARPGDSHWPVPLLSQETPEASFDTPTTNIAADGTIRLNHDGSGFYHTYYAPDTFAAMVRQAAEGAMQPLTLQSFMLDTVYLCRSGHYNARQLLDLITAASRTDSYAVWEAIQVGIDAVKSIINGDEAIIPDFHHFIVTITSDQYKRLGWEPRTDEDYFDVQLRPLLIGLMVYAEDPQATARALALYDSAAALTDIPADMRRIVAMAAARERNRTAVEHLVRWYATASAEDQMKLASAITAVRDTETAQYITSLFTTKTIKPQDLRHWFVGIIRTPQTKHVAWQWMVDNWDWISATYKNGHEYSDFPKYSAMGLCTDDELAAYTAFFEKKERETELTRLIAQGIDDISSRSSWRTRDLPLISTYLREHR